MFSRVYVCLSTCLHVTITHNVLNLTVQTLPRHESPPVLALHPASYILWPSLETCSNLFIRPHCTAAPRSPRYLTWGPTPSLPLPPLPLSYPDIRPVQYLKGTINRHSFSQMWDHVSVYFNQIQTAKKKDKKAKPSLYSNW